MRRLGAHLSISGGIHKAVESTVDKGGNCLQIFSSSPRMWLAESPGVDEVTKFKDLCRQHDVTSVFIHAKYLINLASDKKSLYELSIKSLEHDFNVADLIDAEGVIVHLGSHQGRGFEAVKKQLVAAIQQILQANPGQSMFLIENSAGQKGKLCSQLAEIKLLFQAIDSGRLGWCLDTCHSYNAGYTIGKALGNTLMQNDIVVEASRLDLVNRLACLHINDSRDDFGSGRDRHENLGEGKMGLAVLAEYVNHPKLKHLPLIIETPGFDHQGPDKKNLEILKSIAATA